ncbi:DUF6199 family natural product biosynthesis protein [Streptomyces sp. CRN 30]|uniref:DUF6199 family natural product biosynthesis protein n=1 Tax=Streptomyces sp. CRN 30 TaxID=3075613 RepID=UPI002A824922|nr:DUF6199 family natural product biosynthesis protein [Streptomyces sp. CRN 30]
MIIAFLCVFAVMGLIQVVRPQLLWQLNRPLQRPFVKDYDATEPSPAGYLMMRVTGVIFLAVVTYMFFAHFS